MLVCPQCQSENPQDHKFCQNCGLSLTEKECCQCETKIPIEAENCHACGAANQTVLWAIFSQPQKLEELVTVNFGRAEREVEKIDIENLSDFFAENSERKKVSSIEQKHLNLKQRYITINVDERQLVERASKDANNIFSQGKVIDKHPLHKSYIATLQEQQREVFAQLKQNSDDSYLFVTQYWNLIGIPTHALPYLILEKHTPVVPPLCDAWQDEERGVVLLPDRSQWQLLSELCLKEKLPVAQIVWFLDEIAKLWIPLSKVSCSSSLLVDSNLRVDEDCSLCLQQLYLDTMGTSPSLQDLIQTWQNCLSKLDRDDLDSLKQLLETSIANQLEDVEQLRLQLQALDSEDNEYDVDMDPEIGKANIPEGVDVFDSDSRVYTLEESQKVNFFDEEEDELFHSSDLEEDATAMIPMCLSSVVDSSCTDIGSQRDHNEDFFGVKTSVSKAENNIEQIINVRGMYIVCDGMGGHAAGEVASAMAVEALEKYFQKYWERDLPDRKAIESGILLANDTLYQTNLNYSRSGSGRMGTTLVMALLQNTQLAIAHVGDSRIYRITRTRGLEKLTLDHEVGQREIDRGVEPEIAYGRPDAYQLTQALGPRDSKYIRPEIQFFDISEDCLLLLCSDGLSDNDLLEKHWEEYLQPLISSSSNLESGLFKLIEFANQYNGHDNITCVLIRIKLQADS